MHLELGVGKGGLLQTRNNDPTQVRDGVLRRGALAPAGGGVAGVPGGADLLVLGTGLVEPGLQGTSKEPVCRNGHEEDEQGDELRFHGPGL